MEDMGKKLYELISAEFESSLKKLDLSPKTLSEVSAYSAELGRLLRRCIEKYVTEEALPNGRLYYNIAKSILEPALRRNYQLINAAADEAQKAADTAAGIHLNPLHPDFPEERVRNVIGAASQQGIEIETAVRRLASPAENITQSFSDDYMQENAEFRSRAGLGVRIERTTDGDCCKWCSSIAGSYPYPDRTPADIFRRHDKCGCLLEYITEKGRQNVRTKIWRQDKERAERIRYAESVPKPTKHTPEQAKELERQLMFASKPGKDDSAIADMDFINSHEFANKFKGKYENADVENAVVSACRQLVKNRNGTFYEEAYFIDAKTGATLSYVKGKKKNGVDMPDNLKKYLTNAHEKSIIMIHNHPNSSPFSRSDYLTSSEYKSCYEALAVGHNGDVFRFRNTFGTKGKYLGLFEENGNEYPYYEAIRDYRVAYSKHTARGASDFEARNTAWNEVSKMRGFIYEKK